MMKFAALLTSLQYEASLLQRFCAPRDAARASEQSPEYLQSSPRKESRVIQDHYSFDQIDHTSEMRKICRKAG
jgi:hypothetical protein